MEQNLVREDLLFQPTFLYLEKVIEYSKFLLHEFDGIFHEEFQSILSFERNATYGIH